MGKKSNQFRPRLALIFLACSLYALINFFNTDVEYETPPITNITDGDTWNCPNCDTENSLWNTGCNECGSWRDWDAWEELK